MNSWISRIVVAASIVATLVVLTGESEQSNLTAAQGTGSVAVVVDQATSPVIDQADWQLSNSKAGRVRSSSSIRR